MAKVFKKLSVGGAGEFNIAYGDTAPEDTTKLWVKTAEPEAVQVSPKVVESKSLEEYIATLPTEAYDITSAAVGTKVYLFGGLNNSGYLDTINVFDTETNSLETLSTTIPAMGNGIAAIGTKIYLFGGLNTSGKFNTINVFDTETNSLEALSTTIPTAASGIAAAAIGTKIYLFGGAGANGRLNTINVFDTETNSLEALSTTIPTAASGIAAAAIGTKIYLFGGSARLINSTTSDNIDTINVFDTETNSLETLSVVLPRKTSSMAIAVIGTKIYLFGGSYTFSDIMSVRLNTINVFDTETNSLETLSTTLPEATNGIEASAVGAKIYLFGGSASSGHLSSINAFTLSVALAANNLLIGTSLTDNLFNLLPSVEIGVKNVYKGNADGVGELVAAALYKDGAWTEI